MDHGAASPTCWHAKWESAQGHAIACATYGAMSWQAPSGPKPEDDWEPDMRRRAQQELVRRHDEEKPTGPGINYEWV
jgi:hypothetical protein